MRHLAPLLLVLLLVACSSHVDGPSAISGAGGGGDVCADEPGAYACTLDDEPCPCSSWSCCGGACVESADDCA